MPTLNLLQQRIIDSPLDSKLFVSGPAGTGKTTAGVERMRIIPGYFIVSLSDT